MKSNTRAAVLATAAIAVVLGVVVAVLATQNPADPPQGGVASELIRDDTHIISEGDSGVVLVEFADFQCPSCGAFAPFVEQLRDEFAGEVTFAFRHFPLPQHDHAIEAAIAAEAAGRQDRFIEMHDALFATQQQWAPMTDVTAAFRSLAEQLDLDLAQYDADIADPALRGRVESDAAGARELGVHSTPTFFLDGVEVKLEKYTDLRDAVVAATKR